MTVVVATATSSLTALSKSATWHEHVVHWNSTLFGRRKSDGTELYVHVQQCMEEGEREGGREDGMRKNGGANI